MNIFHLKNAELEPTLQMYKGRVVLRGEHCRRRLKVASQKHNIFIHFPKDRNCEIWQRTKITRAQCRRRIGGAVPRAENFGDLITADHKVLSEGCESRTTITDMQSWCRTWPPNGSSRIRAKQKLHRKLKGACKSSWSRIRSLKSFTLTIPWNLA